MPTRNEISVQQAAISSAEALYEIAVQLKRIANVTEHRHYGITTKEVSEAIEALHDSASKRLAEEQLADTDPAEDEVWVSQNRCLLVNRWADGTMTVATRDAPGESWGPPHLVQRERNE